MKNVFPKGAKLALSGPKKCRTELLGFLFRIATKAHGRVRFSGKGVPSLAMPIFIRIAQVAFEGSVFLRRRSRMRAWIFARCIFQAAGSLFYDRIGLSSIMLLLVSGVAVAVPPVHLCCWVPLLAAGMDAEFDTTTWPKTGNTSRQCTTRPWQSRGFQLPLKTDTS